MLHPGDVSRQGEWQDGAAMKADSVADCSRLGSWDLAEIVQSDSLSGLQGRGGVSRLWKGIWITSALTIGLAVLVVLTLIVGVLTGFTWPTHDQSVLKAIRADALVLMDTMSANNNGIVPESQWPPAIASLEPAFVVVFPPDTVDIVTKPFFDGGWGYRVLRNEREAPQPAGRYSELGHGVYWFRPY